MSGNTFITPQAVANLASVVADDLLTVGQVVSRDQEVRFGGKIGDELTLAVPPVLGDADEFTGTTSATAMKNVGVKLRLEKHFYKRVDLTSKDRALNLVDFGKQIVVPNMRAITQSLDKYILRKGTGFRTNLVGTVTNRPSTIAHLAAANKFLNDKHISKTGRVCLVDTTVESALLQSASFVNQDYVPDGGAAIKNATLGNRYGFQFVTDALLDAFNRGDVAGTIKVDGGIAAGAVVAKIKGLTAETGVIYAGTVFVITGDTTRYTVTEDATIAASGTSLLVYPAIKANVADEAVVTFEAAGYMNLAYHPGAIAAAIVAPEPLWGMQSSVGSFNGISVRVSMDGSLSSLSDSVVFDVMCGCRVIQPDGGCLICG